MEKEVSRLHSETAGVEAEIKALQDKIMEIGGVKLRSQKAKVDGLKQQIDTLTETMSNSEVSKSKEEKQYIKHEKAFADATKELEKLVLESENIDDDMQAQKRDAAGTRQQAEEAQEVRVHWNLALALLTLLSQALDARKEELQAVKKELDERTAELNETRAIEIEMRNKLEEGQKSLNEYLKKQKYYQDKIEKLSYQNLR
jgi:structural maintenance of chromosome 4